MQQKWHVVPTFIMKSYLKLGDKYDDLKQQIKSDLSSLLKDVMGIAELRIKSKFGCEPINVQRLMQSMKLKSLIRAVKYRSYKGEIDALFNNILQRQFKADKPNQKWVTDVTEFNVRGDKLYLRLWTCCGEIISFQTQRRPTFR